MLRYLLLARFRKWTHGWRQVHRHFGFLWCILRNLCISCSTPAHRCPYIPSQRASSLCLTACSGQHDLNSFSPLAAWVGLGVLCKLEFSPSGLIVMDDVEGWRTVGTGGRDCFGGLYLIGDLSGCLFGYPGNLPDTFVIDTGCQLFGGLWFVTTQSPGLRTCGWQLALTLLLGCAGGG